MECNELLDDLSGPCSLPLGQVEVALDLLSSSSAPHDCDRRRFSLEKRVEFSRYCLLAVTGAMNLRISK